MSHRTTRLRPPSYLRAETRRWWSSIYNSFELESHHVKLLTAAAQALDRAEQAREAIRKRGMTYQDRFGQPRARPEVAIERDSRLAFARLVRELGLDSENPPDTRPPRLGGAAS